MSALLAYWKPIVAILAILGAFAFGYFKGYESEKSKYDLFVAKVTADGEQAEAKAVAKEDANKLAKENADHENQVAISNLNATIGKLRAQHSGGSFLPPAASGSLRPDLACFDRTAYLAAFGEFVTEARGLVDEGAAATVDLDTAKLWAQGR